MASLFFIRPAGPLDAAVRRRVRRYFDAAPSPWPIRQIWIGWCMVASGPVLVRLGVPFAPSVCVVLLGACIAGLGHWRAGLPSTIANEADVDALAEADLAAARARALEAFQLDPEELHHEGPCSFRSSGAGEATGAAFAGEKLGRDNRRRWTPHDLTVVHFGYDQMFVYRCSMDLTTGEVILERTYELAYRELVSIETHSEKDVLPVPEPSDALARLRRALRSWFRRQLDREPLPPSRMLQVDGHQTLGVRLASGERIDLASWQGHLAGVPTQEVGLNVAASRHLQRVIRELKRHTARPRRPPRIVRQRGV